MWNPDLATTKITLESRRGTVQKEEGGIKRQESHRNRQKGMNKSKAGSAHTQKNVITLDLSQKAEK